MAKRSSGRGAAQPDWGASALDRASFIDLVWKEGEARYRDLPWRNIDDPYAVLVSEVMLQQTQVARVLGFWPRFLNAFPTIDALAAASTSDVLGAWQGLGYNRRALALKRCADECAAHNGGALPQTAAELEALPGIGPATAAGVMAFACNKPSVYIETNVRTVFLHCLFPDAEGMRDRELEPYVADVCPHGGGDRGPRAWYYALLDYGAALKSQVGNASRRSAHYTRQSAFEGSHRQKRSYVVREVLAAPEGVRKENVASSLAQFERAHGREAPDSAAFDALVGELVSEGFFHSDGDLLVP